MHTTSPLGKWLQEWGRVEYWCGINLLLYVPNAFQWVVIRPHKVNFLFLVPHAGQWRAGQFSLYYIMRCNQYSACNHSVYTTALSGFAIHASIFWLPGYTSLVSRLHPLWCILLFGDTVNFLLWVALNNYSCVWSGQRVVWLEWYLAHVLELKRIISPHVWSCWLELSVAESEVEWKLLCMEVLLVYLRLTIAFQWLHFRSPGQRSVKCLLPMDLKETAT